MRNLDALEIFGGFDLYQERLTNLIREKLITRPSSEVERLDSLLSQDSTMKGKLRRLISRAERFVITQEDIEALEFPLSFNASDPFFDRIRIIQNLSSEQRNYLLNQISSGGFSLGTHSSEDFILQSYLTHEALDEIFKIAKKRTESISPPY